VTLPDTGRTQFNYTTNNGTITITGYTGPGGDAVIPDATNGLPVTSIAAVAFQFCSSLTSMTVPRSVTNIGYAPWIFCYSLTAITVDALNPAYAGVDGVLIDKSRAMVVQYPPGKAGAYVIPDGVASIGEYAFAACSYLSGVTIPNSVTDIGRYAFNGCGNLTSFVIPRSVTKIGVAALAYCASPTGVYFEGNALMDTPYNTSSWFLGDSATVYYLPRTTGWGATFGGCPTALWRPLLQTSSSCSGVGTNQFGFNITWASDMVVVVEACTNVTNPTWLPVGTNTLIRGSSCFSEPQSTNYTSRFYRIRSP
jgi:hypothetical protein